MQAKIVSSYLLVNGSAVGLLRAVTCLGLGVTISRNLYLLITSDDSLVVVFIL